MKPIPSILPRLALLTAVAGLGFAAPTRGFAAGKPPATAPEITPSTGGAGGGGKHTAPVAPKPPAPPLGLLTPLTFTPAVALNNVVPACVGSYQVDPYYPTLSLLSVSVDVSSVNVPDGTQLYVYVHGVGGTLYGSFTTSVIAVTAQAGTCLLKEYITPGTVIQSVVIADATGAVILNGN